MSNVRDILGPIPRRKGRAYQHLNDVEQYDQHLDELREARQKKAVRKQYINTFSNLNKYKTKHIKVARTFAQKPVNTSAKHRVQSQMANKKKTFSFTKSQEAEFKDNKRRRDESSSTSAWSSSSNEQDKPKNTISRRQVIVNIGNMCVYISNTATDNTLNLYLTYSEYNIAVLTRIRFSVTL